MVEESRSRDFEAARVVYRGRDRARVMSGKPDGDWYYRARTEGEGPAWGEVIRVSVAHHPLAQALGFLALGAVVFLATVAALIRGAGSAR